MAPPPQTVLLASSNPGKLTELRAQLSVAGERRSFRLAQAGIWYDALDALSQQVDASPRDAVPRLRRAAILEQVGLVDVALAERSAAGEAGGE